MQKGGRTACAFVKIGCYKCIGRPIRETLYRTSMPACCILCNNGLSRRNAYTGPALLAEPFLCQPEVAQACRQSTNWLDLCRLTFDDEHVLVQAYLKAVELLIELASLQTAFLTLDEAIKTTNRRVNALDNVVRPRLENTIAYIKVSCADPLGLSSRLSCSQHPAARV